ncbi:hypothetical protein [Paracidovorax cattleyae]|uniref:hypothetical protein n=1 Tax=Paracidovorax cattleyae TaxID=80868 RepID=UPI000B83F802|nr:hypothetical protein [Paracidovorax cattleyae]AVS72808.1 thioredoxin [Paracidovorax cattleyae]
MRLDPWDDAARIAERLALPGAKLIVLVGAAGWCEKCRQALPAFDARARVAPPNETHVWMDLEEHAGLLGAWIPETLPVELVYENGRQAAHRYWEQGASDAGSVPGMIAEAPDLWRALSHRDWAEEQGS